MSGKSAVGKVRLHGAASERPSFGWAQDVPVSQLARACYYLSILVLTFYDHICILLWKLMVNRWLGDETAAKTPWTQYISVAAAQGSNTVPSLLPKAFRDGAGLDALANNLSRLLGIRETNAAIPPAFGQHEEDLVGSHVCGTPSGVLTSR